MYFLELVNNHPYNIAVTPSYLAHCLHEVPHNPVLQWLYNLIPINQSKSSFTTRL